MKFLHLADLHLGRRLCDAPLLEDQRHILGEILEIARRESVDAVLLAGDVYDKPVPPVEAVALLDEFLTALSQLGAAIMLVSGNHDSSERLAFGGRLMDKRRVYVAPAFDGAAPPVTFSDAYGAVQVFLLPFVKPAHVRRVYPEDPLEDYTQAVAAVLRRWAPDPAARHVLLCHQLVTGGTRSESEYISIGGLDNVDGAVFDGFDYVALGHLHRPQSVGRETVRYAGSPLAYSFSEGEQEKSVTVVELLEMADRDALYEPQPVRMDRLIRSVAEAMEIKANRYGCSLRLYLAENLTVPGVEERLRQIFINLIDNAVKYGESKEVIRIVGRRRPEGALFYVENRPAQRLAGEELEAVFEPFYRADKNYSREQGSSGLGLSICRKITGEHGGRIWAENTEDGRVRFYVFFPWKEEKNEE